MTAAPRPRVLPQAVLDAMPGAVAQLSEEGEILGVNAAWRTLAERFQPTPSTNVTPGANYLEACQQATAAGVAELGEAAAAVRGILAGVEEQAAFEYRLTTSTGTKWLELCAKRLEGDGFRGALVTQTDISARKTAGEALVRSEEQYRAIVQNAPVGIYQTAPDGRILSANQSLADIVAAGSADDLIGTNITRFYARTGERESLIAQRRAEPARTPIELEWKRADGVPIWVEIAARAITDTAGRTVYWEGFVYDISERKRLEAQLMQSQKMESVGRLAGGIAHDFNNLLTVMIGYAELLHSSDDVPPEFRPAVGEILSAARRAAELTSRMLTFARKQRVEPRTINVNDVVRGIEGMLRRILGEDVRLEVRLADKLPTVLIDPAQLEQVLMNLVVNARDAMPGGGVLTIATEAVEIGGDEARRRPGMRAGRQVRVSVADTGMGMDAETLARAFEPFFTTKDPGKGTGLGLAMCYGIIKQANGFIWCDSRRNVGTTCTVLLPATAASSGASAPSHAAPSSAAMRSEVTPARGHATILVVEDEPVVRRFVVDVLTGLGHTVHATGSPQEGLDIAAVQRPLDLLVADLVLPQMDGVTLAARIRAHHPHVVVILMSGYQEHAVSAPDSLAPDSPASDSRGSDSRAGEPTPMLLSKPFTAVQLRARVEEALQRRR